MPRIPLTFPATGIVARLNLHRVECTMLWPAPEDAETRAAAFEAAAKHVLMEEVRRNSDLQALPIEPEGPATLERLSRGPSTEEIREATRPRLYEGALVGEIMWTVLREAKRKGSPRFGEIKDRVLRRFNRSAAGRPFDMRHLDNRIMPRMRPAAHFWTAYVDRKKGAGETTFPCTVARLPGLLLDAEKILSRGAETRPHGGKVPIMDPAIAWRAIPR